MLGLCPHGQVKDVTREVVISMWWIYIVMPVLFAAGIYGFLSWVGVQKRFLTRKTDRTAEGMYDEFADPPGDRPRGS
jgi:hypothetical protein